jgi:hypothetical protein
MTAAAAAAAAAAVEEEEEEAGSQLGCCTRRGKVGFPTHAHTQRDKPSQALARAAVHRQAHAAQATAGRGCACSGPGCARARPAATAARMHVYAAGPPRPAPPRPHPPHGCWAAAAAAAAPNCLITQQPRTIATVTAPLARCEARCARAGAWGRRSQSMVAGSPRSVARHSPLEATAFYRAHPGGWRSACGGSSNNACSA